jgi:hypothetical protein
LWKVFERIQQASYTPKSCNSIILRAMVSLLLFYFSFIYLISNPFSCNDFKRGSGGTFATHGLIRCPPTVNWHDAQSPFVQLYFGFTPSAATADFKGDPGLKSFFFPWYANTVMCKADDDPLTLVAERDDVLAC